MKNNVIIEMDIWKLSRFCECLEVYNTCQEAYNVMPSDMYIDFLIAAIREWRDAHDYTRLVIDDIEQVLYSLCRLPLCQIRYGRLLTALGRIKDEML